MKRKQPLATKETPLPGRLPQPRKLPSQSRSRALVEAVVQACLRILDEEGAQALTIQRIAEVSGATVGSIYQYFPNKDAIITLVYDCVLKEEAVEVALVRQRISKLPLVEALHEIVANTIRLELRLFRLNGKFHLKYYRDLQLGMRLGPYQNSQDYVDGTWMKFLGIYAAEVTAPDWNTAAYMLGIGLRAVVRMALEDDLARLEQPEFLESLVNMALGAIKPPRPGVLQQMSASSGDLDRPA